MCFPVHIQLYCLHIYNGCIFGGIRLGLQDLLMMGTELVCDEESDGTQDRFICART